MELVFGVVLEAHKMWSTPGFQDKQTQPLFRLMVAHVWSMSVAGDCGPHMSAAVMWCLHESPMTLGGDQWRQDLAQKVVVPLQKHCDWLQGKPVG